MKIVINILIICLLVYLIPVSAYAQDTIWEEIDEGEIEDASFIVEKSLKIELPKKNRAIVEKLQFIKKD